jgi:hypothetical protein
MPDKSLVEKVQAIVLEMINDLDQRIERRPFSISSRLQPDIDKLLAGVQPMIDRLNDAVSSGISYDEFIWRAQCEIVNLYAENDYPRAELERNPYVWNLRMWLARL